MALGVRILGQFPLIVDLQAYTQRVARSATKYAQLPESIRNAP